VHRSRFARLGNESYETLETNVYLLKYNKNELVICHSIANSYYRCDKGNVYVFGIIWERFIGLVHTVVTGRPSPTNAASLPGSERPGWLT